MTLTAGQHRRRMDAWGASEMPMVMALAGHRDIDLLPKYMQERVRPMARHGDTPRLYLEKAGVVRKLAVGSAAFVGTERERELLAAWAMDLAMEDYAIPEETVLDVETLRHASTVPPEWMPLRSRRGRVAVTPDGWIRDHFGDLYDVEAKCTQGDALECRWVWRAQVQAQGLVTGSAGAFVVQGSRWARVERDDGGVARAFVAPDEAMRTQIVEASEEAWARVEDLRAKYGSTKEVCK